MRGRCGVIAGRKQTTQLAWSEPYSPGMLKHVRLIWIKRGGTGRQSGSGPTGYKATARALLSRSLRERVGVAAAVTARQAARVAEKARLGK